MCTCIPCFQSPSFSSSFSSSLLFIHPFPPIVRPSFLHSFLFCICLFLSFHTACPKPCLHLLFPIIHILLNIITHSSIPSHCLPLACAFLHPQFLPSLPPSGSSTFPSHHHAYLLSCPVLSSFPSSHPPRRRCPLYPWRSGVATVRDLTGAQGKHLCGGQYLFALQSAGPPQPPASVPLWERLITGVSTGTVLGLAFLDLHMSIPLFLTSRTHSSSLSSSLIFQSILFSSSVPL